MPRVEAIPAARNSLFLLILYVASCGESQPPLIDSSAALQAAREQSKSAPSSGDVARATSQRTYRGAYRQAGRRYQFRPCGSNETFEVIGTADMGVRLREALRWNTVWPERPVYAVFQGDLIRDVIRVPPPGGRGTPQDREVTRFSLTAIDTVRHMRDGDCANARLPWP
jgi:hypothetical protein